MRSLPVVETTVNGHRDGCFRDVLPTGEDEDTALRQWSVNKTWRISPRRFESEIPDDQSITSLSSPTANTFFLTKMGPFNCAGRAMGKRLPIPATVLVLPHCLHVTLFSRNYLEFRPWLQSPSDQTVGKLLSPH